MKNVEITDNSIVLKSKAGTLTLFANDTSIGLFLENTKGQLNIVSQPNMKPYICFYNDHSHIPYAISMNDEGTDLQIQVVDADTKEVSFHYLKEVLKYLPVVVTGPT